MGHLFLRVSRCRLLLLTGQAIAAYPRVMKIARLGPTIKSSAAKRDTPVSSDLASPVPWRRATKTFILLVRKATVGSPVKAEPRPLMWKRQSL
jgi:hypothetical protein